MPLAPPYVYRQNRQVAFMLRWYRCETMVRWWYRVKHPVTDVLGALAPAVACSSRRTSSSTEDAYPLPMNTWSTCSDRR